MTTGPALGQDIKWDKKTRTMLNNDIVFPAAYAFVMKRISDFEPEKGTVNVAMTFILRIKIDDHHDNEEVVNFLKESLKMRINEVEVSVIEDLKAKVVMSASSTATGED